MFDVVFLHDNEKGIYGDIPRRCLDIVDSVGSPNLRLVFDPANYVQCGVRPFDEAFAMVRPHLEYVHLKDAVMGSGEVRLPARAMARFAKSYASFILTDSPASSRSNPISEASTRSAGSAVLTLANGPPGFRVPPRRRRRGLPMSTRRTPRLAVNPWPIGCAVAASTDHEARSRRRSPISRSSGTGR